MTKGPRYPTATLHSSSNETSLWLGSLRCPTGVSEACISVQLPFFRSLPPPPPHHPLAGPLQRLCPPLFFFNTPPPPPRQVSLLSTIIPTLALSNVCRVVMAVAIVPMAALYGWGPAMQGLVQVSGQGSLH